MDGVLGGTQSVGGLSQVEITITQLFFRSQEPQLLNCETGSGSFSGTNFSFGAA